MTRSLVLIFTVNVPAALLIAGCVAGGPTTEKSYRHVELQATADPLAPRMAFPAWTPPQQMAVWVHPHRDPDARALVGGHWVLMLLDGGHWYTEDITDRDPVPDAEATPEDIEAARATFHVGPGAVIPYRTRAGKIR